MAAGWRAAQLHDRTRADTKNDVEVEVDIAKSEHSKEGQNFCNGCAKVDSNGCRWFMACGPPPLWLHQWSRCRRCCKQARLLLASCLKAALLRAGCLAA